MSLVVKSKSRCTEAGQGNSIGFAGVFSSLYAAAYSLQF